MGCKAFLERVLNTKKVKWHVLERLINVAFFNEELKDLHLCLNAPKLDAKVASTQLLGAYNVAVLPSELIEADFLARGRLSNSYQLAGHPVTV